ncbi:hypothetical protein BH11PLA1_BH11PLA1_13960 [soil metagenome]
MKWFWLAILGLAVAGVAAVVLRERADGRSEGPANPKITDASGAAANIPASAQVAKSETTDVSGEAARPNAPLSHPVPEAATPEAPPSLDDLLGTQDPMKKMGLMEEPTKVDLPASADVSKPTATDAPAPAPAKAPAVEKRADGSMLLDGRFVLRGSGTAADPYRLPWDLLVSIEETYAPRQGLTKIPERVKMLDGKFVRISGFTAFPVTSDNPREMLVMLNQWDGCCIGVPPRPYDAIEVMLDKAPTPDAKGALQGTVSGILHVDPVVDQGWLIGVYAIDGAKVSVAE